MRKSLFILVIALGIVSVLFTGCSGSTGTSNTTTKTWVTVTSWKGNGAKTTETFQIKGKEWRISWETKNEPFAGAGIFQIYVHDNDGNLISLAANKQGVGSDISYVKKAGKFYLTINSGNVDWSIKVEEQR